MMCLMESKDQIFDVVVDVTAEELYTRVVMGPGERGDQIETEGDARHFAELLRTHCSTASRSPTAADA